MRKVTFFLFASLFISVLVACQNQQPEDLQPTPPSSVNSAEPSSEGFVQHGISFSKEINDVNFFAFSKGKRTPFTFSVVI